MPSIRLKDSGQLLGTITEEEVDFLRADLESDSTDATTFYIDNATVDALADAGGSPHLLVMLRDALRRKGEADVELVDAQSPDASPRIDAGVALDTEAMADAVPIEEVASDAESDEVEVNGHALHCVVCQGRRFQHRRAQLHTALATLFNMEWTGATADCYVCRDCGYVHWFLQ